MWLGKCAGKVSCAKRGHAARQRVKRGAVSSTQPVWCQHRRITPDPGVCLSDLRLWGQHEIGHNPRRIGCCRIEGNGKEMHIGEGAALVDIGAYAGAQFAARNGGRGVSRIKGHGDINLAICKKLAQCRVIRRIGTPAAPQLRACIIQPCP